MTPLATEITDYDTLLVVLRSRADELHLSRETLDHIAGMPDRYSSKNLSLSKVRRIGMISLGPLLNALGLKLIAVPDHDALDRNRPLMVRRNEGQVRVHHPAA